MAKVAKFEPNAEVVIGSEVFRFDDDGTRNVSEAEAALLEGAQLNGGLSGLTITETKKGK